MQKNIKFLLKLFFVIIAPIVALIYYIIHIHEVLDKGIIAIIVSTLPVLLIFFNAAFYSFHMSSTKLFGRWTVFIFTGFGLLIAIDDDETLVIILGCFGLTFRYSNLFKEQNKNLKPENKF